MMMMMMIN